MVPSATRGDAAVPAASASSTLWSAAGPAVATTHVPIRLLAAQLRADKIELAIELSNQACADLKLSRCRIGVCGLNPHAGEEGLFGDEESRLIVPAVQAVRDRGLTSVSGPFPAYQAGVRAAAAQGPDALRRYIWRTRMVYNFYYADFAPGV